MSAPRGAWADIAALGVSQIVGYGTLYYSFGTLAPAMAHDVGWPVEWVFGALSAALLAGGLVAPWTGRWLDRFGAGRVMAVGSLAAATALVAAALAPAAPAFVLALVAIEVASTFVQYGAAFPLLVQRHPATAQRSILYLTLIAGFASTLFWPLTTWLHAALSWQAVYLVFAALNLVICLPIHLWLARRPKTMPLTPDAAKPLAPPVPVKGLIPPALRGRAFLLMGLGFACQSLVVSSVLIHMLPILTALGLGLAGVMVSAVFGPAQVAGRFTLMVFGRDLSPLALAVISAALLPASLVLLAATAPSTAGAAVFAALFGLGNGLYSIVGGTLPLALFGADGYGALQGRVTSIRLVVGSIAPFAFALAADGLGTQGGLLIAAFVGCGAIVAFATVGLLTGPRVVLREANDGPP
ncbi:arsenite efflux MFS transporter ArsK [Aureimonas phyllosphaerae]|uniref:MFS family permease n=1 Tax=Aureimonas phyllosphaerae TaxID=1166078 RepID=A0A7W6BXU6_9HYPH|nr:arsenite efflux MFS transporter ArsK [Aureimonas phyllosphaerae]MBB3938064.1 MFS family permease [Aureimonas phyllosphaerae]MBB3962060.1 MFS family permease [Aureimonas phyllosphaerae]SFF55161.1 Major Facilitator Superfamily protein [Aureimonas phyllosphaerae]